MTPTEIKAAREAAGLTQVELAERIGVTQAAVAQWETGGTKPYPISLRAIHAVLGPNSASKVRSKVTKGKHVKH